MSTPITVPGQPEAMKSVEHLCDSHFGDVKVELRGSVEYRGRLNSAVELQDVVLAGTTISIESALSATQWENFCRIAQEAYMRELTGWAA